jgi:uncharacterized protein YycO
MYKIFKNLLVFSFSILLVFSVFSGTTKVNATENDVLSYDEYLKLIEDGTYGEDVSYEAALDLLKESGSGLSQNQVSASENTTGNMSIMASGLSGYNPKPGDILITNDSVGSGAVGHAGIIMSNGNVLHFAGKKLGILNESVSKWKGRYKKTNVYRIPNASLASSAATWAYNNYWVKNRSASYKIDTQLYAKDPSYCSKIVWQAYYYGTGSTKVVNVPGTKLAPPYRLKDTLFTASFKPKLIEREFAL